MLIINADDWGRNRTVTDNSLKCFKNARITSASAMVFMADSKRAAELAREHGLGTGLHLNFTLPFDGNPKSSQLIESQRRIVSFLKMSKYCSLFYHPGLRKEFEYVYNNEYEEYIRLYRKEPTHIDGHHHMHLCANMLVNKLIPKGFKVRRGFTLSSGEKNVFNRFYRRLVDVILLRRYTCTDYFFSITPHQNTERLQNIVNIAKSRSVELMVHPGRSDEYDYLMSDDYLQLISEVQKGSYASL